MRERAVPAFGVSVVDFGLRYAFHRIWIYKKKGRLLFAVAVARYPLSKPFHNSQYKM
jgi:hypothetical protein